MRFNGLLNSILIGELAALGHTDLIVIADAGFPIPSGPKVVDLSITAGFPSFLQVCQVIGLETPIESVLIATEMQEKNLDVFKKFNLEVKSWEQKNRNASIPVNMTDHDNFKKISKNARLVIRTGEFSPYANAIIYSGCAF